MNRRVILRTICSSAGALALAPVSKMAAALLQVGRRVVAVPVPRVRAVPRRYPGGLNRRYKSEPSLGGVRRVLTGAAYPDAYVRPDTWLLNVGVRGEEGEWTSRPKDVDSFEWRIEGPGFDPIVVRNNQGDEIDRTIIEVPAGRAPRVGPLRERVPDGVTGGRAARRGPAVSQAARKRPDPVENDGPFHADADLRVSLTLKRTNGAVEQSSQAFTISDYMMAVIGDSAAAGQGNPDREGEPLPVGRLQCEATTIAQLTGGGIYMAREAKWFEPAAYRSLRSGHFSALKDFEDGEKGRLVTRLTFATSGAEIVKGLIKPQHSWQEMFGSQIDELQATLRRANRPLDALVMSIGGNDVGFSGVLTDLTKDQVTILGTWSKGKRMKDVIDECERKQRDLPELYDQLNAKIVHDLNPAVVFITEYPQGLFNDDQGAPASGCGLFQMSAAATLNTVPGRGISKADAREIALFGGRLNETIREAARRHGWVYVGGISSEFDHHGYCADNSFWVGAEQSCKRQGDLNGTMHPNHKGHEVYRRRILEALVDTFLRQERPRPKRISDHRGKAPTGKPPVRSIPNDGDRGAKPKGKELRRRR